MSIDFYCVPTLLSQAIEDYFLDRQDSLGRQINREKESLYFGWTNPVHILKLSINKATINIINTPVQSPNDSKYQSDTAINWNPFVSDNNQEDISSQKIETKEDFFSFISHIESFGLTIIDEFHEIVQPADIIDMVNRRDKIEFVHISDEL